MTYNYLNYSLIFNRLIHNYDDNTHIKFFCVFGDYGNEIIFFMSENGLFAFGNNKNGLLGLGHMNTIEEPTKVIELSNQQIINMSFGHDFSVALTDSGQCYSWGYNNYAQLGNGNKLGCFEPKLINGSNDEFIIDISCGACHTLVLTKSGVVYGFGYNGEGRLGCGDNREHLTITKVTGLDLYKVVSISCGYAHSLALTEKGEVFSWGWNSAGQLGIGNNSNQNSPTKVILDDGVVIKWITCGNQHSFLLTSDGDIYAFGANNSGQLGNSNYVGKNIPAKINTDLKFNQISSSSLSNISVAKSENGFCYVWGECDNQTFSLPKETIFQNIYDTFAFYSKTKRTIKSKFSTLKPQKNRLIEMLSKSFNDPEKSDLKIKVEGKLIYVHKKILQLFCKHFESMLSKNWSESTLGQIEMNDYSYNAYYAFLKYIYTDSIDIKPEDAIDLLDLANCYLEEELKQKCIKIIKSQISVENVCTLYSLSVKYESRELEDFCFNFASNKMNEISKTEAFELMGENLLLRFFKRYGENNLFK